MIFDDRGEWVGTVRVWPQCAQDRGELAADRGCVWRGASMVGAVWVPIERCSQENGLSPRSPFAVFTWSAIKNKTSRMSSVMHFTTSSGLSQLSAVERSELDRHLMRSDRSPGTEEPGTPEAACTPSVPRFRRWTASARATPPAPRPSHCLRPDRA